MGKEKCMVVCASIIGVALILSSAIICVFGGSSSRYSYLEKGSRPHVFDTKTGIVYTVDSYSDEKTYSFAIDFVKGRRTMTPVRDE